MSVENPRDDYGSLSTSNLKKKKFHDDEDDSDSSWNDSVEDYIKEILADCERAAAAHEKAGYECKKLHSRWAFPGTIIPTISAPIVGAFKDQWWSLYLSLCAMTLTAICTGFSNFYNFGEKSALHFNYSGKYADITTNIKECLCKHRSKRTGGSVMLRTVRMQYDSLNLSAPET